MSYIIVLYGKQIQMHHVMTREIPWTIYLASIHQRLAHCLRRPMRAKSRLSISPYLSTAFISLQISEYARAVGSEVYYVCSGVLIALTLKYSTCMGQVYINVY